MTAASRKRGTFGRFGVGICNAMAGSNVEPLRSARILRKTLRAFPNAAVVGVVEASLLRTIPRELWEPVNDKRRLRLLQSDDLAKSGSAVVIDAARVEVIRWEYRLGVEPIIAGRRIKMRRRYVLVLVCRIDGRKRRERVRVLHFPPERFWQLWATMRRQVGPNSIELSDFNRTERQVEAATGKKAELSGVVGIEIPVTRTLAHYATADVDGDHLAVYGEVNHRGPRIP